MSNDTISSSDIISHDYEYSSESALESTMESTLGSTLESTLESSPESRLHASSPILSNTNTIESVEIDSIEEVNTILAQPHDNVIENSPKYECIICLEGNNVILNPLCECKFYFHEQCYSNWLFSNDKQCILCKKDLSQKVDVSLFHIDDDGILTDYLVNHRNRILQLNVPVTRPRNPPIYGTNRIQDAQIYVVRENSRGEPEPIIENHDPPLLVTCFGSRRRRNIIGVFLCSGFFSYVIYELIMNV